MQTDEPDQTSDDSVSGQNPGSTAPAEGADMVVPVATPGEVLKAERLRLNLSEQDVSEKLHITMHYVRAIESNRFDKLPGAVFAKGYIKSYALYLNLNVDAVTALFDGVNSRQEEQIIEANRKLMAQRRRDKNKPWVYASVGCFVLGFAGLWAFNHFAAGNVVEPEVSATDALTSVSPAGNNPAATVTPEQSPTTAQLPDTTAGIQPARPEPAPAPATTPATTTQPNLLTVLSAAANRQSAVKSAATSNVISVAGQGNDVLRIKFSGESWVEVNDNNDQQIYRDIRKAGDVLEITGHAPFNILLGDAPFARMTLNGTEIDVSDNIRIDNSARLTVGL